VHDRIGVGTIAVSCALGYLDYRYAARSWREQCPATAVWFERFSARSSMQAARPP